MNPNQPKPKKIITEIIFLTNKLYLNLFFFIKNLNLVFQEEIVLSPKPRGFHLITGQVIKNFPIITGIANVFIKHTSASLTINENADPSVRVDFETHFNKLVSENDLHYTHTLEGPDDMTSHIKSTIIGSSVTFPVKEGKPLLGIWQGIYLRLRPRLIINVNALYWLELQHQLWHQHQFRIGGINLGYFPTDQIL